MLVALACAGCGASSSSHRTLTVWAVGRESEIIARLLPEFSRRHPEIEVRVQQLPELALNPLDVLGRRVRTIELVGAQDSAQWDGRDDAGLVQPPGVFWAVVRGTNQQARVVLVH